MSESFILEIPLNPDEQALAEDTRKQFERLFNKFVSWEDVFKYSLFFLNNTQKHKIARVDSYNDSVTSTTHETPVQATRTQTPKKVKNSNRKARKIPYKQKSSNQSSLGGF